MTINLLVERFRFHGIGERWTWCETIWLLGCNSFCQKGRSCFDHTRLKSWYDLSNLTLNINTIGVINWYFTKEFVWSTRIQHQTDSNTAGSGSSTISLAPHSTSSVVLPLTPTWEVLQVIFLHEINLIR